VDAGSTHFLWTFWILDYYNMHGFKLWLTGILFREFYWLFGRLNYSFRFVSKNFAISLLIPNASLVYHHGNYIIIEAIR
jgi:hypothetical protein